ncbi:outer membrane protein [uncultured Devosia sp.]|uniref:outer membrane protein n=1 Tax=uncultured Devosia sp. TaxID=211434 RepID=UPI0035CC5E16
MMRKLILALAGTVLLTATAHAADFGWTDNSGAAPMFAQTSAFQWSGFYAGVNGGYGFGTLSRKPAGGGVATKTNTDGASLGGQVGYNVDMGGFVLGGEADLQWSSIAYDANLGALGRLKASVDGFGTVRGRAGMAFDRVMPYVTAGFAYGRSTVSLTNPADVVTSQTNTHFGWTVGAGLEAAATDNITLKAEYLYVDLGSQTYTTAPGGSIDASQRFSVIRGGVNYKF